MKKREPRDTAKKLIVGLLIPSILLPSCEKDSLFVSDNVHDINTVYNNEGINSSVAVPISGSDEESMKFMRSVSFLVHDIILYPKIAEKFIEDPHGVAKSYGVDDYNITFDDEFLSLLSLFADRDIHEAVMAKDVSRFFDVCVQLGIIKDVDQAAILKIVNSTNVNIAPVEAGLVAGAAVFVLAVAGIALVAGNAIAIYDQAVFWDESEGDAEDKNSKTSLIQNRDSIAYHLWQTRIKDTYILDSEYKSNLLNMAVSVINKYMPNIIGDISEEQLKRLLSKHINLL